MKKFNLEAFVNRKRPNCTVTHVTTYPERLLIGIEMVSGQVEYRQRRFICVKELNCMVDPRHALARMIKEIRKSMREIIQTHKDNQ